jgi:hypothetical protein
MNSNLWEFLYYRFFAGLNPAMNTPGQQDVAVLRGKRVITTRSLQLCRWPSLFVAYHASPQLSRAHFHTLDESRAGDDAPRVFTCSAYYFF